MATTATPTKPKTTAIEILDDSAPDTRRIRMDYAVGVFPHLFTPRVSRKKGAPVDPKRKPVYSMVVPLTQDTERTLRALLAEICKKSRMDVPEGNQSCLRKTRRPEGCDADLYPVMLNMTAASQKRDGTPMEPLRVLHADGKTQMTAEEAERFSCVGGGLFRLYLTIKALPNDSSVACWMDTVQCYGKLGPYGKIGSGGVREVESIQDDEDPVDPDDLP